MQNGCLERKVVIETPGGEKVRLTFFRFLSRDDRHMALASVAVTPLSGNVYVQVESYLDGDVRNEDANYEENFWTIEENTACDDHTYLAARTRKTEFLLGVAQSVRLWIDGSELALTKEIHRSGARNGWIIGTDVSEGCILTVDKYVAVYTSRDMEEDEIADVSITKTREARDTGRDMLFTRHKDAMADIWEQMDVEIVGDDLAQ